MRNCGPARSRNAPSTLVVNNVRMPSTPSTLSTRVKEPASASRTRAGTGPVTCTSGRTLRGERHAKLPQFRARRCSRDDEHPGDVGAGAESRVGGKHREPELPACPVRVRYRSNPAVEREGAPPAIPEVREVT